MVAMKDLMEQFRRLNIRPSFWVRAEIKELAFVILPGEQLTQVVFGWYANGFALLCCTDQRVLLIDKKPFFLTLEDLRYDKIQEVKYLYRLLDSTVALSYAGKTLEFKSWDQKRLRQLVGYIQERIMQINMQLTQSQAASDNGFTAPVLSNAVAPSAAQISYIDYPMPAVAAPAAQLNPYSRGTQFMRRRVSKFLLDH